MGEIVNMAPNVPPLLILLHINEVTFFTLSSSVYLQHYCQYCFFGTDTGIVTDVITILTLRDCSVCSVYLIVLSLCVFPPQEECLGQGSFTRIFKGSKTDVHDGEKHVAEVLLKELDVVHKNCWEVCLFR